MRVTISSTILWLYNVPSENVPLTVADTALGRLLRDMQIKLPCDMSGRKLVLELNYVDLSNLQIHTLLSAIAVFPADRRTEVNLQFTEGRMSARRHIMTGFHGDYSSSLLTRTIF